ncbi:sensor histidine kinase [Tenacibaculum sp. 190524A05c]|uniref:sensor histidine kinase n=1 Tax=Tenacibaculum platacis TaxID=3137852 RepID=UPI0031FB6172
MNSLLSKTNKLFILTIFIFIADFLYSQEKFKNHIDKLYEYNLLFEGNDLESLYLKFQAELIIDARPNIKIHQAIKTKVKSNRDSILFALIEGDNVWFSNNFKRDSISFTNYFSAYQKSIEQNDSTLICESLNRINRYCLESEENIKDFGFYSNQYISFANSNYQKAKSKFFRLSYILQSNFLINNSLPNNILDLFNKDIAFCKNHNEIYVMAEFHNLLGVTYDVFYKKLDRSLDNYQIAEKIFSTQKKLNYFKTKLFNIYINKAHIYHQKKQYEPSNIEIAKALKINPKKNNIRIKRALELVSSNFQKLNQLDSSLYYLKKSKTLGDSIGLIQKAIAISDITEKYQAEKKEKENLELRAKRKQDKILLFSGALFMILGSLIAYLNLKNSRRKRLLAEQQKELEKQKNLTLLKEQEITTINAMVAGQEKERIRIAEDLHDNIGSVLATLKLHFENLKLNREKKHFNQEELYNKTEKLIDETYLKVRSIAHAKNAGVIANQGLLVAIKIMADKISSANQLHIEIVDFGLDKPIESNLEITIFRIIQELITNTIKHAEATEVTINLSLFDENLNVIVEDNGKGFNESKINFKKGMGLGSIQKRIEHYNGTFQIDSVLNRGTSIILNIPV